MKCWSLEVTNSPVHPANLHGLVVVVTAVGVPKNKNEGPVKDQILLCCRPLFLLSNGKVDDRVQMLFVKGVAASCVGVAASCQLQLVTRKLSALTEVDEFPDSP